MSEKIIALCNVFQYLLRLLSHTYADGKTLSRQKSVKQQKNNFIDRKNTKKVKNAQIFLTGSLITSLSLVNLFGARYLLPRILRFYKN
jgi:cell division protein FtsB